MVQNEQRVFLFDIRRVGRRREGGKDANPVRFDERLVAVCVHGAHVGHRTTGVLGQLRRCDRAHELQARVHDSGLKQDPAVVHGAVEVVEARERVHYRKHAHSHEFGVARLVEQQVRQDGHPSIVVEKLGRVAVAIHHARQRVRRLALHAVSKHP